MPNITNNQQKIKHINEFVEQFRIQKYIINDQFDN
jgi:hypothetical protein